MLEVETGDIELYDEIKNEFVIIPSVKIKLENSLLSISKWESRTHRPFLDGKEKTIDDTLDYISDMCIGKSPGEAVMKNLPSNVLKKINDYVNDPMTATTISDNSNPKRNGKVKTSEVLYAYMIKLGIPFDCEKWHINRLITLIKVCDIMSGDNKKMSKQEILRQNRELNAARKKKYNTKG